MPSNLKRSLSSVCARHAYSRLRQVSLVVNDEQTEVTDISIEVRSVALMYAEHLTQMCYVSVVWMAIDFVRLPGLFSLHRPGLL